MKRGASEMEAEIKKLEAELENLSKSTEDLRNEMSVLSSRVDQLLVILRSRLRDMYKYSFLEKANALFALRSAHEAVELGYFMEFMARLDRLAVEELHLKSTALETAKVELSRREERASELVDTIRSYKARYEAAEKNIARTLENSKREREKALAATRELEEAEEFVARTILARVDRRRALEKLEKGGMILPQDSEALNAPAVAPASRLDWPITGPLASRFGYGAHPTFNTRFNNTGIDIRATAHAPVKAAADGEVLFVGSMTGFGLTVVLDHGRSFFTVYACLSAARVKDIDKVRVGDVIGTVGDTGTMTGYSLHFEVRMGREAKDPIQYLKKL
ncbi:peptidase M23 [Synergistales bacterium]|nr:peptidase M23 [Synergistales bacterium]